MIALPSNPTGADLVQAIRAHAAELGTSAFCLAEQLSSCPSSWLAQTSRAHSPRSHTIDRVKALLANQAVAPPPNNFEVKTLDGPQPLTQRETRVYKRLVAVAARGEVCPANSEFWAEVRSHSSALASSLITSIERKGWIVVQRGSCRRVVTIIATGQATAGEVTKPRHYGKRPATPAHRLATINSPKAIDGRVQSRMMDAEDLAARIDRDQAERRAERERWLDIEQQRYGLTRRGRLPEDMPA